MSQFWTVQGADAEIAGDLLMGPAPLGEPNDLKAAPVHKVGDLEISLLEASGLEVVDYDADHGAIPKREIGRTPRATNRTASAGF